MVHARGSLSVGVAVHVRDIQIFRSKVKGEEGFGQSK